jgi:hypothetical protein
MYVLNFQKTFHNHQASYCNCNAVDLCSESTRIEYQLRCSAILTSSSRISLFYRGQLQSSGPTHRDLSTTVVLPLLAANNNFLVTFKSVTFSGERMLLRMLRLNHSLNKTSGTNIRRVCLNFQCILKQARQ